MDGCFWHGCPDHHTAAKTNSDFWAAKVDGNRRRDAETSTLLTASGWTVIRVWEHVPVQEAVNLIVGVVADARERQQSAARTTQTAENHFLSGSIPPQR